MYVCLYNSLTALFIVDV